LEPLHARLAANVFAAAKLFADDTPIAVLDPGRGRTKTGRLWVYTRDDRPCASPPDAKYGALRQWAAHHCPFYTSWVDHGRQDARLSRSGAR
jgi:hypothetical protein